MPDFSNAWNWANNPLVPKSAIQGTQDYLEEPQLEQSPWMARMKGFGSGALEGLRGLTSPINLAGIASMGIGGGVGAGARMAEEAPALVSGVSRAMPAFSRITPDLVEAGQGIRQALPTAADTSALEGLLKYGLAKVPQGSGIASEAGRITPEAAILGGGTAAGLGYAGKKLYDMLQNPAVNPYQRASDVLKGR